MASSESSSVGNATASSAMDGRKLTASTSLQLVEGRSPPAAQLQQLPVAGIGLIECMSRARTSTALFPSQERDYSGECWVERLTGGNCLECGEERQPLLSE